MLQYIPAELGVPSQHFHQTTPSHVYLRKAPLQWPVLNPLDAEPELHVKAE